MQLYCVARRMAGRMTARYDIDIHNVALYWHFTAFTAVHHRGGSCWVSAGGVERKARSLVISRDDVDARANQDGALPIRSERKLVGHGRRAHVMGWALFRLLWHRRDLVRQNSRARRFSGNRARGDSRYTLAALAVVGFIGWIGYRRHSFGWAGLPHDDDTPEDRHRFLGFATFYWPR